MNHPIEIESVRGVAWITLDRPKANAYTRAFLDELFQSLETVFVNPAVRVAVIRSANPKFFSAGADIKAFSAGDAAEQQAVAAAARRVAGLIESSPVIVIAAIRGHALGGGLELALACDLRLGGDGAYLLGLPEVKLGLMPGNGGSQRLTRVVGLAKGLELCLTGESVSPAEAYRIGLLNHLYPAEEFEERVQTFAQALAEGPPTAMAAIKQAVRQGFDEPLEQGLALEERLSSGLYATPESHEGLSAYLEKRAAVYPDRKHPPRAV